jgi:hypothetical protein
MPFSASARASSGFLTGRNPVDTPSNINLAAERFTVGLTTADLALNSIGAVGILPAGAVPMFLEIDATDMDSNATPALAFSLGVVNNAETAISTASADGGAAWLTGRQEGRSAGVSGLLTSAAMRAVTPAQVDRKIGVQITAAAATPVAGTLGVTLYYRMA